MVDLMFTSYFFSFFLHYSMCKLYFVLVLLLLLMMMMMTMMMINDDAEWLLEAYRTQWLAMLQVDGGRDLGSVLHVSYSSISQYIVTSCI